MSKKQDDLFPADEDEADAVDEFQRLSTLLFERVNAFAEEENVSDEILPFLVLQLSATLRMGSYVMTTAKPSAGSSSILTDFVARRTISCAR